MNKKHSIVALMWFLLFGRSPPPLELGSIIISVYFNKEGIYVIGEIRIHSVKKYYNRIEAIVLARG